MCDHACNNAACGFDSRAISSTVVVQDCDARTKDGMHTDDGTDQSAVEEMHEEEAGYNHTYIELDEPTYKTEAGKVRQAAEQQAEITALRITNRNSGDKMNGKGRGNGGIGAGTLGGIVAAAVVAVIAVVALVTHRKQKNGGSFARMEEGDRTRRLNIPVVQSGVLGTKLT